MEALSAQLEIPARRLSTLSTIRQWEGYTNLLEICSDTSDAEALSASPLPGGSDRRAGRRVRRNPPESRIGRVPTWASCERPADRGRIARISPPRREGLT